MSLNPEHWTDGPAAWPACGTDAEAARYVEAWFIFVGPDGELSTDRNAPHVAVGATTEGRVRVRVPEGLDLAPGVAEHVAGRIGEAVLVARDLAHRFTCKTEGQGVITVGATPAGRVRVIMPEDLDMAPRLAEAIGRQVAKAAVIAGELPGGDS
jgi:hypothetical protein